MEQVIVLDRGIKGMLRTSSFETIMIKIVVIALSHAQNLGGIAPDGIGRQSLCQISDHCTLIGRSIGAPLTR